MSMIHRFGLLMESLSSCMFLLQLLSLLSKDSSAFSLISIFFFKLWKCLPPGLDCWSGFELHFLFDLGDFSFSGFLFDSSFSVVFCIFIKSFFHTLCCLLYFIYLFFIISLVSFWRLLTPSLRRISFMFYWFGPLFLLFLFC
jgi:hypothetical protein